MNTFMKHRKRPFNNKNTKSWTKNGNSSPSRLDIFLVGTVYPTIKYTWLHLIISPKFSFAKIMKKSQIMNFLSYFLLFFIKQTQLTA